MRFGILGPLLIGGGEATVTATRDRVVLSMLLLHAGRVVLVDELVDAIWSVDPPNTARGQVQTCVSRLRRVLDAAGIPATVIGTDPAGYRCDLGPDDLDARVFERLADEGRSAAAAGDLRMARERYRAALALWRGPALAGVSGQRVRHGAALLDERRLVATEECVDIELTLGLARELVGELTQLVEAHPMRERLRVRLIRALHQAGRPAEALAAYRAGRKLLVDELGIEPGPELQEAHQRVLAGDPRAAAPDTGSDRRIRCLPRAVGDFTGLADVLDRVLALTEPPEAAAPVQVIDGMAGSGKTSLAVHIANLVSPRYPDASLFVDLHGHSERGPLEPGAALTTLLRQLGVSGEAIPADLDERAALWRSELGGRRAVVVLDNAAGTEQVRHLLPGTGDCLTLITSRHRLAGLDGVRTESLRLLTTGEAVDLLARIVGDRVRDEPEAAALVVHRCGRLPLAIRLAGARLAHRPNWRVADLADRLRLDGQRLGELTAEHRSVAGAFQLSYDHLPEPARTLFRLLGLHPGERFDGYAAAALADLPLPEARRLLDELVDRHLLEEPVVGRYRLHDLVREYAESLVGELPATDRAAAVTGLLDYYLHATATVTAVLESPSSRQGFEPGTAARPDLVSPDLAGSLEWLEVERPNLTAMVRFAAAEEQPRYAHLIARAAWRFYYQRSYHDDLIETHRRGLAAAERTGDARAAATMRNFLASGYFRADQQERAIEQLIALLEVHQRDGDQAELARTLLNLSIPYTYLGQFDVALRHVTAALQLRRRTQDLPGLSHALTALADANLRMGRFDVALDWGRRSLQLACELRVTAHRGVILTNVGAARVRLGHYRPAYRLLRAALIYMRRSGNRFGEGEVLHDLGLALYGLGRPDEAIRMYREALEKLTGVGNRSRLTELRNSLARALHEVGAADEALTLFREVLAAPATARYPLERARALEGVGDCLADADPVTARRHWREALRTYRELDRPEQVRVAGRLTGGADHLRVG
nr:BTAD domain-containing putative transcriptional regulator [Micromonospora sp. DSM 115978]